MTRRDSQTTFSRTTPRTSRLFRVLALPLIAATVLAACGSSSATTSAKATASASPGRQTFRDCLAAHGVTLPQRPSGAPRPSGGPGGGGFGGGFGGGQLPPGVDASKFQAAMQACNSLRPAGGFGSGAGLQAVQAYRSCMADHGVTLPQRPTGSPAPGSSPSTIDRTSPTYVAANQVCAALLPQRGSGGPGGGAPSPSPTSA